MTVGRIVSGLGLLVFGTLAGLSLIEIVPRLLPRLLPTEYRGLQRVYAGRAKWEDMMVSDPYLGYRPKSGLNIVLPSEGRMIPVRTTSYGLGDIGFRDIGARAPFAVITLGDSFTFCDDVPAERCWVRQLAQSTGLSVATLGVSGYSTLAEARVLERYGMRLKPRLVLVAVFANDFNDNLDFDAWTRSGDPNFWTWRSRLEGRGAIGRWFADHSEVYRLIDAAVRADRTKSYRYKDGRLDLVFRTDRWWLPSPNGDRERERERGWELMQHALRAMQADAASIGAEFGVVLIPAKEEVYWDIVRAHLPNKGTVEVDHPLEVVRRFCVENGIHVCDLTAALQSQAHGGRQLYLRVSGHWNDDGNTVAASALAGCLADQGLVQKLLNESPAGDEPPAR
jgi:hypothetical protein